MAIHANWDKSYITHDLDIFFYYLGGITTAFTLITLLGKLLFGKIKKKIIFIYFENHK